MAQNDIAYQIINPTGVQNAKLCTAILRGGQSFITCDIYLFARK
jgi:hypothetical protein